MPSEKLTGEGVAESEELPDRQDLEIEAEQQR